MEWISVTDEFPWAECDIKLTDNSVLLKVIPQFDRDFYWKNDQQGEVFIREEAVTHWRHVTPPGKGDK